MAEEKKGGHTLLWVSIAAVLVLVAVPVILLLDQPIEQNTSTGQNIINEPPASSQIINEPQQPPGQPIPPQPPAQQPATPKDDECRSLDMDFDTCMLFLNKVCFSNADCGPLTCQGNKCLPD